MSERRVLSFFIVSGVLFLSAILSSQADPFVARGSHDFHGTRYGGWGGMPLNGYYRMIDQAGMIANQMFVNPYDPNSTLQGLSLMRANAVYDGMVDEADYMYGLNQPEAEEDEGSGDPMYDAAVEYYRGSSAY